MDGQENRGWSGNTGMVDDEAAPWRQHHGMAWEQFMSCEVCPANDGFTSRSGTEHWGQASRNGRLTTEGCQVHDRISNVAHVWSWMEQNEGADLMNLSCLPLALVPSPPPSLPTPVLTPLACLRCSTSERGNARAARMATAMAVACTVDSGGSVLSCPCTTARKAGTSAAARAGRRDEVRASFTAMATA